MLLLPKGDAPIVQYDVKTGKRKALCWLQDYYFDKYGISLAKSTHEHLQ